MFNSSPLDVVGKRVEKIVDVVNMALKWFPEENLYILSCKQLFDLVGVTDHQALFKVDQSIEFLWEGLKGFLAQKGVELGEW
jgi:hypothetical protein